MNTLKIKKLHADAIIPTYATAGAACFDLYALTVMGAYTIGGNIEHGHPLECGTGLAVEVPEGHVMMIFSRSGYGFKQSIRLANCVGIIDSDFRGEVRVKITKDYQWDDLLDGSAPAFIKPGDRIAQAMLLPVQQWAIQEVTELSATARGAGGFGSTGA